MESATISHLLESIRVCVKIFPTHRKVKESSPVLIDGNARFGEKKIDSHCISVVDERRLQILPVNRCICDKCKRKNNSTSNDTSKNKTHSPDSTQKIFQFDHVLNQTASQAELFECVRENIETLFSGISSTIVSFGPSGSGKTYMMRGEGNAENVGLIQRSIRAVFDKISREHSGQFTVELSYIELAKNCFNNLLSAYISDSIVKKSQSSSWSPRTPERFISPSNRSRSVSQAEHFTYSPGRSPSRSPGPHYSKRSPSPARGPGGDPSSPGAEGAGDWIPVNERLELHSSPTGAAFFTGPRSAPTISQIQVETEQEAMEAIFSGDRQLALLSKPNRRPGHLVISLHLMRIEPGAKSVQQATLQLVDLAVAGDRSDPGQSLADGGDTQFINRSMLALNEVLKRLALNTERVGRAESGGETAYSDSCIVDSVLIGSTSSSASCSSSLAVACTPHVPYMDSKLTMMLRDSLGGATRAVLVTSIQLDSSQFKQNLHTLETVSRAGKVLKNIYSSSSGCIESTVLSRMGCGNSPSHKRLLNLALSPELVSSSPRVHISHSHSRDLSHDRTNIPLSNLESSSSVEDLSRPAPASLPRAFNSLSQSRDEGLSSDASSKSRSSLNWVDILSNPNEKFSGCKNTVTFPDGNHTSSRIEDSEELTTLPSSRTLLRNSPSRTSVSPGKFKRSLQPDSVGPPSLRSIGFGRTSSPPCKTKSSPQNEGTNGFMSSSPTKSQQSRSHNRGRVSTSPEKNMSPPKESVVSLSLSRSRSPPIRSRDRQVLDLNVLKTRSSMSPKRVHTPSKIGNETGSPAKVPPPVPHVCSVTRPPEDPSTKSISVHDSALGIAEGGRESNNIPTSRPSSPVRKSSLSARYTPPCSPHSLVSPKTSLASAPCSRPLSSSATGNIRSPINGKSPRHAPIHSSNSLMDGKLTPPHSSTRLSTTPHRKDDKSSLTKPFGSRTFTFDGFISNDTDDDIQKSNKPSLRVPSPRSLPLSPSTIIGAKSSRLDPSASTDKLGSREEILPIWQKKTATSLWREEDERRQREQREKEKPRSISPSTRRIDDNGSMNSPQATSRWRQKAAEEATRSPTLDSTYPDDSSFEGGQMQKLEDLRKKSCEDIHFESPLPLEESQSVVLSENETAAVVVSLEADTAEQIDRIVGMPASTCLPVNIAVLTEEQNQLHTTTPLMEEVSTVPQLPIAITPERVSLGDSQLKSTELLDRYHMDNLLLKKKVEALRNAFIHIDQKLQAAAKNPKFSAELFSQSDEMITRCVVAKSESFEAEKELDYKIESGTNRFATEKSWRKSLEKECACLKDLMKLEKVVSQRVDSRDAPIAKSVMKSLMKLLETCDRLRNEINEVRMQVDSEYATLLDGKDRMGMLRENFMGVYDCFDDGNKKLLQLLSHGDERAQLLETFREKMRQALLAEMQRQEIESQLMFTRMRRMKEENEADQQEIAEIEEERLAAAASLKKDHNEEARAGRAACMHSERTIKSLRSVRRELSLELEIMGTIMNKMNEESAARTAANEIASSFDDLKSLIAASPIMTKCNIPAVSIAKNNFLANLSTTMALTSPLSKTSLSTRAVKKQKFTFDETENLEKENLTQINIDTFKGGKVKDEHMVTESVSEQFEFEELSDKENCPANTSPRVATLPSSPEKWKTSSPSSSPTPHHKDRTTAERAKQQRTSPPRSGSSSNSNRNRQVSQHGPISSELSSLEASISEGKSLLQELMLFCESFSDS